ncbi:cyclopropane-fatty-acyl-phospholipid synthase [bacterium]|nr:cyclopropane-fatty-acyl-phospholipid synthase [bacterium]|tara:strand:+ start:10976 stop:12085 length:1110 start_codon:yes stop_codon:yes gene_type:complete
MNYAQKGAELLGRAGITVGGKDPWDPQVHHPDTFKRAFKGGTISIGESYMDGWWDVEDLAAFFYKIFRSNIHNKFVNVGVAWHVARARIFNLQSVRRSRQVGEKHYDIGNELYRKMLGSRMVYTCGYWKHAHTLDEAQEAKLDLVCRKIGLRKGDRVLDIGGGWGSFAKYAAERYGANVVAITISEEQAKLGRELTSGLPVEIRVQDYRNVDEKFDHIVSLGMFEHVGYRNYRTFMKKVRSLLKDEGLFLLHTIGGNKTAFTADPWINKYIFPNGMLPSIAQIGKSVEGLFVMEDWHNFGADYDRTLMSWHKNFTASWNDIGGNYDERFRRMWEFYLLSSAATFRSRKNQLWQIVLSKDGVDAGYESIR